jgi:hypothetical protein
MYESDTLFYDLWKRLGRLCVCKSNMGKQRITKSHAHVASCGMFFVHWYLACFFRSNWHKCGHISLGLFVLILAATRRLVGRETRFFEVSFLLFLVGFLYFTLHSRLIQLPFPVSIPEKPLVDNNLTFNYASTSLLTFLAFPVCLLIVMRSNVSLKSLGFRVFDSKQTFSYAFLGTIFNIIIFLLSHTLFGFRWIPEYTLDGLILWVLLVSLLSVFAQVFFFIGLLFNKYSDHENSILLAIISILAFQMFISSSVPWTIANVIASTAKIVVTWKTRNIYGATSMSIATNLTDIFIQVL